jgi:hypothetical protein
MDADKLVIGRKRTLSNESSDNEERSPKLARLAKKRQLTPSRTSATEEIKKKLFRSALVRISSGKSNCPHTKQDISCNMCALRMAYLEDLTPEDRWYTEHVPDTFSDNQIYCYGGEEVCLLQSHNSDSEVECPDVDDDTATPPAGECPEEKSRAKKNTREARTSVLTRHLRFYGTDSLFCEPCADLLEEKISIGEDGEALYYEHFIEETLYMMVKSLENDFVSWMSNEQKDTPVDVPVSGSLVTVIN